MAVSRSQSKNRLMFFILATLVVSLALYPFWAFKLAEGAHASLWKIPELILLATLAYLAVRGLSAVLFGIVFRLRRGYEAPVLARNIFSIVAFTVLFILIFKNVYEDVNLGALFTTSAILGVIIGLALQDTLGNFFAGISLHADRPFQVGDVIVVGQQKLTGVVESISWRAIKLRNFRNHTVLVSNSVVAKESIEVCARDELNARYVPFSTPYTVSPARTIQVVREAIRDAENVSQRITPIVRIRNFSDSAIEWEIKYWLEDYARYNTTDALLRQRVWYAFHRARINFAFPTLTIQRELKAAPSDERDVIERLAAVDIFAPLSAAETEKLAAASVSRVFAPGEAVIRAGQEGSSMFVVQHGRVQVQITENGSPRTVATLGKGDFFGEMALLTGEPRSANVVAIEETEVLEIGHEAMKQLFETNPNLCETISWTVAERRAGLTATQQEAKTTIPESDGLLASIQRFFGLK